MLRRFLTQRRALAVVVVLLLVGSLLRPGAAAAVSRLPRNVIEAVTGWVALPLVWLSNTLRPPVALEVDRGPRTLLQDNYDELLKAHAALVAEVAQLQRDLALTRRMQQMGLSRRTVPVEADVTAWFGDGARQALTLNVGGNRGLRPGLAVADAQQFRLIGRLSDVGASTATVDLVTSPGTTLRVRLLPGVRRDESPVPAVVLHVHSDRAGRFSASSKRDGAVQVGWLAHLDDPAWAPDALGLVVGQVTAIAPDNESIPNLYSRLTVQPLMDPARVSSVVVFLPQEAPSR